MIVLGVFVVAVAVEVGLVLRNENRLQSGELRNLFCTEVGGLVEHQAVAVAEDIGREPAGETEAAGTDDGGEAGLHESLTGLEVLAGDRHLGLFGKLPHGGDVDSGVGCAHDEGAALGEGGIGVTHRGSDAVLIVGLHGGLESGERSVNLLVDGNVNLSGSGPEHDNAVDSSLFLEVADILADLLRHVPTILDGLHVVAVKTLGVVVVEGSLHGLDLLELVLYRIDIFFFEHLGVDGGLVGIGGIYIPGAEHDVVKTREGNDVFVVEIFLVGSASYAHLVILCHRADGFGEPLAGHEYAGHESGGNSSETDHEHAQLSVGLFCFL